MPKRPKRNGRKTPPRPPAIPPTGPSIGVNTGQTSYASGSGITHTPFNVGRDYYAGGPPAGTEVSWPIRVGLVPQLADNFQIRSGPQGEIAAGSALGGTTVLTQTQVLTGLGGNGKSQLAAARARELWDAQQLDLLAWITAASRDAVLTGYAQAARSVGLPVDPSDPEHAAAAFLSWAESTDKRWLVVLDDVSDPAHLTGLWPSGPSGRVLVTTRRHDKVFSERGRAVIDVGLFTGDEALAYLSAKVNRVNSQPSMLEQAADLANDLGLLPLALAQATAVIAEQGWTCAEYRSRFNDQRLRLADLLPVDALADDYASGPQAEQRATIATTWKLSIEAADQLPPVGLALPLLQLAAYLDPNGIPITVFLSEPTSAFLNTSNSAFVSSGDYREIDTTEVRQALGNLARLSLLDLDGPAAYATTIGVHALVQRAVRDETLELSQQSAGRYAADALLESWPVDDYVPQNSFLAASLRANSFRLQQHVGGLVWAGDVHPLHFRAGRSLIGSGLVVQAVDYWTEITFEISIALGPDHRDTLSARSFLALSYRDIGRLDAAISLLEENLGLEQRAGRERREMLPTQNNLASTYRAAGRLAEAVPLLEATLAGCEELLGREDPDTLTTRNNLALAYKDVGKLTEAVPLLEATLADRERLLGRGHPETLASRNNLALAYQDLGQLDKALPLLKACLRDCKRLLGLEHPRTLTSRSNLAIAYQAVGRLAEAVHLLEVAVSDRRRLLGRQHPDTLASCNNLALVYRDMGRLDEVVPLLETTLVDSGQSLGCEHPNTLLTRNNLAMAYRAVGRLVEAIPLLEAAVIGYERILGREHSSTISTRENLAAVRAEIGWSHS